MGLFTGKRPELGVHDGRLKPCPSSPNCVCSYATPEDKQHHIDPLPLLGSVDESLAQLVRVLEDRSDAEIIERTDRYIRVEFTTRLLRFVDDVEFLIDEAAGVIQVRSASRLGHSDLGANRKRIETLRKQWTKLV
ncbi:DUF1499 domain-containing protein [Thalassoroseus pseudoceratinae]|uniref:DUF1499 domain-containing protein n=1 Tax=Thalassoroseus pseudoceratinae TaxID=2713176 RepID=UPI001421F0F2|nr:DUF1499 domain-containing protein [Thalassoroseus pseudoceratinae]